MKSLIKSGSLLLLTALFSSVLSCSKSTPADDPDDVDIETPASLSSRVLANGSVTLNWKNNALSSGYEIELVNTDKSYSTATNYYTIPKSDLGYATTYTWRVRTLINDSKSEWASSAFTTGAQPQSADYIGIWKADPEDVSISAKVSIYELSLSDLMPDQFESDDPMLLEVSEFVENEAVVDNKVILEMSNIQEYLPVTDMGRITLDCKSDQTLSGEYGQSQAIIQEFEEPIPLSQIPGLEDVLDGFAIDANIRSVSVQVASVMITGMFPDSQDHSKAQFNIMMTATLGIATDNDLANTLIEVILGSTAMTITATVDCVKQ